MATGILGTPTDLSAGVDAPVYTCPSSTFAVLTVSICNRGASSANVRVAISNTGTPGNADYLEFDTALSAKGVLERTGIVVQAGKVLVVRSSAVDVNVVAYGIETTTA